ncbi:MAG TPA: FHA domain-containing protein [Anaerolineales bacterium]|nr:FHA domain-containing protein [Anaerolineales bacterium]
MSRRMRAYYYALLGAIGGLIAWQVSDQLGLSFTPNLYLNEVLVGALIGLSVGLLIGATEGVVTLNPVRAVRASLFSGPLGLAAGAIGLPLGEWIFQLAGAEVIGRALGWGVFGLLIGVAEGLTGKTQMWKGALGGVLGGVLGGALLEGARRWLNDPLLGKAAGLVLLGASVGAFIALITVLLSKAWLEVTSGKLKGAEFILDKFISPNGPAAIIGSDALKADIALPDPDIAPQHALLTGAGTHFNLKDMSLAGTYVNNRKIEMTALADRQTIRLGNTELVYHEKR